MSAKKRFLARHAKSSAALISLAIHATLLIVATSYVVVKVIVKEDQAFEAKPVNRPKMELKKLQVPVNVKKKQNRMPKLNKRIVVNPRINRSTPDIQMPEIAGIKGGMGGVGREGMEAFGGIGFTLPKIEIFGVKSQGEKVFLILDAGKAMLEDDIGGVPAYTIIKEELMRIVEELPSTTLFNICVFDGGGVETLFPGLVSATSANTEKVKEWLEPLNRSGTNQNGLGTLGDGGEDQTMDLRIGKFAEPIKRGGGVYAEDKPSYGNAWFTAVMLAMKHQADSIFLLTESFGYHNANLTKVMELEEWIKTTSEGRKWKENLDKAKELLEKENEKRRERGEDEKVVAGGRFGLIAEYFPGSPEPPSKEAEKYNFTPRDFAEAFVQTRKKYASDGLQVRSGLQRKSRSKDSFSLNVIQFIGAGESPGNYSPPRFSEMTKLCKGEYRTVAGLQAIQNYVQPDPEDE